MRTKYLLMTFIGVSLAVAACRQAETEPQEAPLQLVDIPVSLGQADGEDGTRSVVDIEVEKFQKAALFAFDAATGLLLCGDAPIAAFSREQRFSWSLPVGREMDIYTIVNYGDLDMESFAREGLRKSELEALRFTSSSPSDLKRLESSGQGMPMAGMRKGVLLSSSGQRLELTVKKLYAKYNLYFDLAQVEAQGWHVQAMHMIVENANTEVPYFVEGFRQDDPSRLVEYDRATEKDLDELQQGRQVTLYMLENCQGPKEGAESWKTVYKDLGFEAVRNCTYIDLSVKVRRTNGEYQDLGYAIYLGKTDMRTDFDIVRNLFKTVRIVLPGPDDPTPASRFFKFSGTESPTVTPGERVDLYFVTNLEKEDISASCSPDGRLTVEKIGYETDGDGIATGFVRLLADSGLQEGSTCLVTAGSAGKNATDQRTVTASWPTVLKVDLAQAPLYVAQAGYLAVTPEGGIVRVDATLKPGSEGILDVREAGVSGSLMHIGLAGLSAGTGTVVLHGYNSVGAELITQEVQVSILAPKLQFGMDRYLLSPDGSVQTGMLFYRKADGSAFSAAELDRFDPTLVRSLLFPTDWLTVSRCGSYVEGRFARDSEEDRKQLCIPVQMRLARLTSQGQELEWTSGELIGTVSYEGKPSAGIPCAEAGLAIVSPFAGIAGTCLGVIENNLPIYEALQENASYLTARSASPSLAFGLTSYRGGKTFSVNGSSLLLELELPIEHAVSAQVEGPEEFRIVCQGKKLILTAVEHPSAYTGYGRKTLYARIAHSVTGELSAPLEMGYLEIYLIGAVGPFIHGTDPYEIGGCIVPDGNRSPLRTLAGPVIRIGENNPYTADAVKNRGLYPTDLGSGHHLYHQFVEIDDHGVDRYAENGETAYLNAYNIRTGTHSLDENVMEFRFGTIFMGHGCGIVDAALECDRMLHVSLSGASRNGRLIHFPAAADKDGSGYSYCAVVDLFGGDGGPVYDVFLEMDGH